MMALAFLILLYPLVVLCVAITGPHSAAEKRDLADYKRWKAGKATEAEVLNMPMPHEAADRAAILKAKEPPNVR